MSCFYIVFIGSTCWNKVLKNLRKKYISPEEAKAHYFPIKLHASEPDATGKEVSVIPDLIYSDISPNQQLKGISEAFKSYCVSYSSVVPLDDSLSLMVSAMEHWKSCVCSNVVYKLIRVLGSLRDDRSDSLLPARLMPMGLIEHCVNSFNSSSVRKVQCT